MLCAFKPSVGNYWPTVKEHFMTPSVDQVWVGRQLPVHSYISSFEKQCSDWPKCKVRLFYRTWYRVSKGSRFLFKFIDILVWCVRMNNKVDLDTDVHINVISICIVNVSRRVRFYQKIGYGFKLYTRVSYIQHHTTLHTTRHWQST